MIRRLNQSWIPGANHRTYDRPNVQVHSNDKTCYIIARCFVTGNWFLLVLPITQLYKTFTFCALFCSQMESPHSFWFMAKQFLVRKYGSVLVYMSDVKARVLMDGWILIGFVMGASSLWFVDNLSVMSTNHVHVSAVAYG